MPFKCTHDSQRHELQCAHASDGRTSQSAVEGAGKSVACVPMAPPHVAARLLAWAHLYMVPHTGGCGWLDHAPGAVTACCASLRLTRGLLAHDCSKGSCRWRRLRMRVAVL